VCDKVVVPVPVPDIVVNNRRKCCQSSGGESIRKTKNKLSK